MHEAGYHVTILEVEVVVGAKDVGGDDAGEHAAILLMVRPAEGITRHFTCSDRVVCLCQPVSNVDDSLGMGVAIV